MAGGQGSCMWASVIRLTAAAGFCLAFATSLAAPVVAQAPAKPNVLLVVIDDMALRDYQVLLRRDELPAIKSLIDDGYEFTESFESGSVSSTSRISILTGQYAQNHHEKGTDLFFGGPVRHNESSLLPNWLRPAGYITAKIGRTIPGYGAGDLTAAEFGAISAGIPGGLPAGFYAGFPKASYVPPGWDVWQVFVEPFTWSVRNYKVSFNGTKVDFGPYNRPLEQAHQNDLLAALGGWFVSAAGATGKPWFLEVAPVAFNREVWPGPDRYNVCADPADPLAWWFGGPYAGVSQRPPLRRMNSIWDADDQDGAERAEQEYPFPTPASFNEADVSDKPRWVQLLPPVSDRDADCLKKRWWRRLELLQSVDDTIGSILQALEESHQMDNTYVVLTSDNGINDGQHRYIEKLSAYEDAIRTILVVRPPGGTASRKISSLVLGIDIAPTIAAIAGATPTITVDGRSLLPLMAAPDAPWRRMGLLQHTLGRYESEDATSPREYWALRIGGAAPRLLVQYPSVLAGVTGEYYDLAQDPDQLNNLFAEPARQPDVTGILPWLNAMKTCSGAWCRWLEDNFNR